MWPLRTAVSGKQMTPAGATEIMEIIGKDETLKRVNAAIEKLKQIRVCKKEIHLKLGDHSPVRTYDGPGRSRLGKTSVIVEKNCIYDQ